MVLPLESEPPDVQKRTIRKIEIRPVECNGNVRLGFDTGKEMPQNHRRQNKCHDENTEQEHE
jgi:hypothetical protein